ALAVHPPTRRQLIEHRPEMRAEAAHAREKPRDRLPGILQLLHVRQEAAGLDGELELRRRTAGPRGERRALGQPVEAVVDFDGIERPRVVLEPTAPEAT